MNMELKIENDKLTSVHINQKDQNNNTNLTVGYIKVMMSSDDNDSNFIVDRILGLNIIDEYKNTNKFIPSSSDVILDISFECN